MARVTISYVFADGDQMQVSAEGKRTYPDALAELRKTAALAFTEAFAEARVTAKDEA